MCIALRSVKFESQVGSLFSIKIFRNGKTITNPVRVREAAGLDFGFSDWPNKLAENLAAVGSRLLSRN
jgi:hypothetical protein